MKLSPFASLRVSLPALAGLLLAACSSGAAPTAGSAAPGSSAAPSGSAVANDAPLKKGLLGGLALTETKSEVELREGKKKVPFTIELPEGIQDTSDAGFAGRKEFRRTKLVLEDKSTHDGYTFEVMGGDPKMVSLGVDGVVDEMMKGGDAQRNKAKIVEKDKTSDGWFFSATFEEKEKKGFVSMTLVTKGDVSLVCRGNYESSKPVDKPEEVSATLVKVCSTLKIAGS